MLRPNRRAGRPGYDFPAARDGRVIRQTVSSGTPRPVEALVFNTRRPIFADPAMREALTLLFDFEWINRNYFFGLYARDGGFFPGSELSAYRRSRQRARARPPRGTTQRHPA